MDSKRPKYFWRIEIKERFTTVFRRTLPGHLSTKEIGNILQRLACKQLTHGEIISASLRKRSRTPILDYRVDGPPRSKRTMIWIPSFSDYIASVWREDELPNEPDIADT
jgi:hypothetical protein